LIEKVKEVIEVCDGIFIQVYDKRGEKWVTICPFTEQIILRDDEKQALADYMI